MDWGRVEAGIDSSLPRDYKELIDSCGGGLIDEYLLLFEPDSGHRAYDLKRAFDQRTEANEILWDLEPPPPEVTENDARLIPWATTDNGEYLYWAAVKGVPPEEWRVLINDASSTLWETYDMTCTEFLASALNRDVVSGILWSRFPRGEHTFRPVREM
ncbi:SMI1/KNR4 family protein [Streptomyces sp. XM4193]|uniref:SMI1/KNR4 family protein n=1 Tax=Streptomyces sp. XM4193 TaxID=2929782 RepID=UPI001FFA43A1|nr:SMI1/KNR4 family protein [Streptomyces sp. XM4193]MCK1798666.1 SMI1/KNR4 family protein [Streptomyces sp. XM4193]